MTTAPALPRDQHVRDRLRGELDATFFVEAGAGTGKTRELVGRIVALVATGRVRMENLAAITFTEAAAAELRDRVRQELERTAADEARPEPERAACEIAAGQVDLAAITTIHAFCGALLRAYPIAAGLPPGFATWDQIQDDLAFEERFRAWLYEEVPDAPPDQAEPPLRAAVRRALAAGLTPDHIRTLAARMQSNADLLTPDTHWAPAGDPLTLAAGIAERLDELEQYVPLARNGEGDPLVGELRRGQALAAPLRLVTALEPALEALAAYAGAGPKLNAGRIGDWDRFPDRSSPVTLIKETLKELRGQAEAALDSARQIILGDLVAGLRDFVLAYAQERKRMGVATFHDLLTWARDLLRDHSSVRRRAAGTYARIFVDEFQDTDPLQAEIAWFLAADPDQAHEQDWRALRLIPGKLFLVGDPKQSIYRFRRADIGMYQLIYQTLSEEPWRVSLTQNFRSVAPVLGWVNHHLSQEMAEEPGVQAPYRALDPHPRAAAIALPDDGCGVYHLGGHRDGASAAQLAWEEAAAIARAARRLYGAVQVADGGTLRPARYADICVLLRARTHVRRLERAFESAGVPYRMESGSLVLDTQEVRDLLSCLRAIDDPTDQVALTGALRSPAYACSDEDLLAWVEAGGALSYVEPADGCDGPVREAFDSLRAFHEARLDRSPAETIERFIRDRLLAPGAFGQKRPREAWRRLRYVVAQARALGGAGRVTLRAVLDWLETLRSRAEYDAESPVPEGDEDAVRLMTVHGSKGLEFPIIILAGLGAGPRAANTTDVLADYRTGELHARCGALRTAGYDAEREKRLLAAEGIRLLYVAATRARDHLVLCLFHNGKECHAQRIEATLAEAPVAVRSLQIEDEYAPTVPPVFVDEPVTADAQPVDAAAHARGEAAWLAAREALISRYAREHRRTPSSLARRAAWAAQDDAPTLFIPDETDVAPLEGGDRASEAVELEGEETNAVPTPAREPNASLRFGQAVHATLQQMDLERADRAGIAPYAAAVVRRFAIEDRLEDVIRLTMGAAQSGPVRAALATGRYWREVPLGTTVAGVLLEGTADLIYEKPDGSAGIVDYKTDDVDAAQANERAAQYRAEGGAYALAVHQVTGKTVSSVAFVFAGLGGDAVIYEGETVSELMDSVRGMVAPAAFLPGGSSPVR